jgi:hypothetical protein
MNGASSVGVRRSTQDFPKSFAMRPDAVPVSPASLISLCTASLLAWLPTVMKTQLGWSMGRIGLVLGILIMAVSSCGKLLSALIIDARVARGVEDAHLRYLFGGLLIAAPLTAAALLMQNEAAFLILLGSWFLLASPVGGYGAAAVQLISPDDIKVQMSALFVFANNVLGLGIGPSVIGYLADNLGGTESINVTLALTIVFVVPVALLIVWRGMGARAPSSRSNPRRRHTVRDRQ